MNHLPALNKRSEARETLHLQDSFASFCRFFGSHDVKIASNGSMGCRQWRQAKRENVELPQGEENQFFRLVSTVMKKPNNNKIRSKRQSTVPILIGESSANEH